MQGGVSEGGTAGKEGEVCPRPHGSNDPEYQNMDKNDRNGSWMYGAVAVVFCPNKERSRAMNVRKQAG